jgi:hypothetical protein
MALYLLPWNPDPGKVNWIWKSPAQYDRLVSDTKSHNVADAYQVWINRNSIRAVDDEVVLFQTGPKPDLRGVYGWGAVIRDPHPTPYGIDINLEWIRCLAYEHRISVDLLQQLVPEYDWVKGHQCSAPLIPEPAAQKLRVVWEHWLTFGPPSR